MKMNNYYYGFSRSMSSSRAFICSLVQLTVEIDDSYADFGGPCYSVRIMRHLLFNDSCGVALPRLFRG